MFILRHQSLVKRSLSRALSKGFGTVSAPLSATFPVVHFADMEVNQGGKQINLCSYMHRSALPTTKAVVLMKYIARSLTT